MGKNVTQKLIESHLVEGRMIPGAEIGLKIDQTLTQDATGTLVMLEFEALGIPRVRTELSAQYVDHNLLQEDFKNADDHLFLRSACKKFGLWYSRPGNGVSHPIHMERFGVPGKTLLGSDSHTCAAGSLGMLAIGAGGLEVAMAMAGEPFCVNMPKILGVKLVGELPDWVSAKDVILEMLRRYNVDGGIGKIVEYYGPGLRSLSAMDRHVIANMGAELGATTTVFPADDAVKEFLKSQGREEAFQEILADKDAEYDEHEEINLSELEPLIALPSIRRWNFMWRARAHRCATRSRACAISAFCPTPTRIPNCGAPWRSSCHRAAKVSPSCCWRRLRAARQDLCTRPAARPASMWRRERAACISATARSSPSARWRCWNSRNCAGSSARTPAPMWSRGSPGTTGSRGSSRSSTRWRPMRVDVFVAGMYEGDGVAFDALQVRDALRRAGFRADLYTDHAHASPRCRRMARHYRDFAAAARRDPADAVIYEYSTASPITGFLAARREPLLLRYQNVTPAEFFDPYDEAMAAQLRRARTELATLSDRACASMNSSAFNTAELESLGFTGGHVLPNFVRVPPWSPKPAGTAPPRILFVGRIAPNKCQHHLAQVAGVVRRAIPGTGLTLVGSREGCPRYSFVVDQFAAAAGGVTMTGHADDPVALYGGADLFLSLSEHEGFCMPLVEAMHAGLPVAAYAAAAVPETVGGGGVVFRDKSLPGVAALVEVAARRPGAPRRAAPRRRGKGARLCPRPPCRAPGGTAGGPGAAPLSGGFVARLEAHRGMILAAILALAVVVRFAGLAGIPPGMWYDEAIYALDGLSIGHGNWPVFFTTENHPREPLYIYSLGGFFALFGHSVLKARIASALWGIATVALFWAFARRAVGTNWSLVAAFAFAVFRWHVHFSRTVFRALLPPFFILGTALFFLRWQERRRHGDAVACGAFLGAGLYTYLSFRLVPVMLALWIAWLLAKRQLAWRRDWRGIALIYGTAAVVFLPLGLDYARYPSHFSGRTGEVSMFTKAVTERAPDGSDVERTVAKTAGEALRDLAGNARDVALMWTVKGDHVGKHNLPHEPVFDWLSGAFFYAGLVWCVLNIARDQFAFLTLAWLCLMAMTSVFSFGAPNLLRMQGATPAAVLALVFGMRWGWRAAAHWVSPNVRAAILGFVLAGFAAIQLDVYFRRFPANEEVRREFNTESFYDPAVLVLNQAGALKEVWVPEELAGHPTFRFVTYGIANVHAYAPGADAPTTGTRPVALLATPRSLQLAAQTGKDQAETMRRAGARMEGFTEMTVGGEDGAPGRRVRWAELWVLR